MSTYLAIEAAVLALCQSAGLGFTTSNSARDDFSVLDDPSGRALIVEMGAPTVEGDTVDGYSRSGCYAERHTLKLTIARQVGTGEEGPTAIIQALKADTEALKDALREDDTLGGLAWNSRPSQTSDVLERRRSVGNQPSSSPTHVLQQVLFQVWCVTPL